ncbi:hypothetical protein AZH53_09070 [Methanomicrobiaceae archaeon CYW5]|uniref:VOC family protein n=1 Tax=Methanovulcanius yangii TaxID=1789227 RepID=UPI0029CA3A27|nr:VOC family protein [Methanovulcanius yangii]MBT8508554.1 hypothetical protein [Methanovulcanius yangii]
MTLNDPPERPVFGGFVLFVTDIARSRAVYEGCFGQIPALETERMVSYKSGLAVWEAEYARTVLYGDPMSGMGTATRHGAEVWFECDDLAPCLHAVTCEGLTFLHPVREEPWGQMTFRCFDPDGHLIEVGETVAGFIGRMHREGMSVAAIAEKTGVAEPVIEEVLGGK